MSASLSCWGPSPFARLLLAEAAKALDMVHGGMRHNDVLVAGPRPRQGSLRSDMAPAANKRKTTTWPRFD